MKSSLEIQTEIEGKLGFLPSFFLPALETPEVLESLWRQTLAAEFDNPLPALFRESVFSHLSQYCSVSYSLVCHCCALHALGKNAEEILKRLEGEILSEGEVLLFLSFEKSPIKSWPDPGSRLWEALFAASVRIFLKSVHSSRYRKELRRLLGPLYAHLTVFLSFIKTSHHWLEAHPEISSETDRKAQEDISQLVKQSPRLEEFFRTYSDRVAKKRAMAASRRSLAREAGKFQILAKTMREGAILADHDTNILFCNRAASEMFGYSAEELLGQPVTLLIPRLFRDALGKTLELNGRKKSREEFPVELTLSSWREEGRETFAATLRDLSKEKLAEKAELQAREILAKKVGELKRRHGEVALLSETARVLQAVLSGKEAYEIISRLGPKFFPEVAGALYVLNDSKILLERVARWGVGFVGAPTLGPADCWALRTGSAHWIENFQADLICPHLGNGWKAQALCIPLIVQGETLGVFSFQALQGLSEAERLLGAAFAEPVALALANLRLRLALRAQAIRDPVTALFNRRYMEESLQRELARAERGATPLGIVMLDVDHFKAFNDAHGHAAGDRLLQGLGSALQRHMRREDIACRFGGEEFLLLLVDASIEDSVRLAEGLREVIKKLRVLYLGQALPPVTVSIGVAGFPGHGATPEELIEAADSALYKAKEEGRNRVKIAPEKPKISTSDPRTRRYERPMEGTSKARLEL